ncbi:MAG TPA: tetratricopeptide repeat protein [Thermoanaerobaculia bacterium]|nr:tetratricopeptide repeat protein [Thermoanaerobaculia bacterium]
MDDSHLTLELLQSIHRGERNPGDLVPVAMAHLFELCPHCRRVFEDWRRELGEGVADASLAQYDPAFDRLRAFVRGGDPGDGEPPGPGPADPPPTGGLRLEEAVARRQAAELLALPARERTERLRRDPAHYSGPVLAGLLLEEARGRIPARPGEAYTVAGLARAVLQHGEPTPYACELYSRALAHQANALRVQGDLRRSDELFEVARFLLKSQGGGQRLAGAELDSFEGSLRRAQRRFDEAQELLSRAVMVYALEGLSVQVARTMLKLGMTYREMGEPERAVEITAQAAELIQQADDPRLALSARHNLAYVLHEAGRSGEAKRLLDESAALYERYGDLSTQLRRLWLEADLAKASGELEAAEDAYRTVRDGFLAQGIGYDAALAALDLALLYAEQRRTADLKRLVEEIVPIFEAEDVHREAATALMLFQDAVRAERVTLAYVVELAGYLERARHDPTLAFQIPT